MRDDELIVKNIYNQKIKILKNDVIGRKIAKKGIYDEVGVQFMVTILTKMQNPVVMDIGANIGNHAIVLSRHCSKILLFEPQERIREILLENLKLNDLSNFKFYDVGLSDKDEELEFFINLTGNRGGSTFLAEKKSESHKKVNVSVKNGDKLLQAEGIQKIDFIKLDVEGHEYNVLKGLKNTIQNNKPIIVMEWNAPALNKHGEDLFSDILAGYQKIAVVSNHSKLYWKKKRLGRMRRFFYRGFAKKTYRLLPVENNLYYEQVLLFSADKSAIIDQL